MADPASTATATTKIVIPVLLEVHNQLKTRGVYNKVADFVLGKESHPILLLGASGAGKSTMLNVLRGEREVADHAPTPGPRSFEGVVGGLNLRYIDTPGQDAHDYLRKQAILRAAGERPLGVINVVAYGYHEGEASATTALADGRPRESYLVARREKEINRLDEWSSVLFGAQGSAAWLLTVVTKADHWWTADASQAVLDYYRNGEYDRALGNARQVPHTVVPFSSLNRRFYGVAPFGGFYDDTLRRRHQNELVGTILELIANASE